MSPGKRKRQSFEHDDAVAARFNDLSEAWNAESRQITQSKEDQLAAIKKRANADVDQLRVDEAAMLVQRRADGEAKIREMEAEIREMEAKIRERMARTRAETDEDCAAIVEEVHQRQAEIYASKAQAFERATQEHDALLREGKRKLEAALKEEERKRDLHKIVSPSATSLQSSAGGSKVQASPVRHSVENLTIRSMLTCKFVSESDHSQIIES